MVLFYANVIIVLDNFLGLLFGREEKEVPDVAGY